MSALNDPCPFCDLSVRMILDESVHAIAIRDAFPVSLGHTLVLSRRHVQDLFKLSECEFADAFFLARRMKNVLLTEFSPTGFNIGINVGRDAGQTVMHAHIHIIPRYEADIENATGGVRNVIPGKGPYNLD